MREAPRCEFFELDPGAPGQRGMSGSAAASNAYLDFVIPFNEL